MISDISAFALAATLLMPVRAELNDAREHDPYVGSHEAADAPEVPAGHSPTRLTR